VRALEADRESFGNVRIDRIGRLELERAASPASPAALACAPQMLGAVGDGPALGFCRLDRRRRRAMQHEEYPYVSNRSDIVALTPTDALHVLDVGCASGGFGKQLKTANPERQVWGIEPHPDAAQQARQHIDEVITGFFPDDLPAGTPKFDLITMNDVIEHLEDPWSALRACHNHLSPDGRVLASIPNVRYWTLVYELVIRGRFAYTDTGLMDRTHLRWFTRSTMLEMFEDCGFVVESVAPINLSTHWAMRSLRAVLPRFGKDVSAIQYVTIARSRRVGTVASEPEATAIG
jgi:2-polyprenyl-3-methyl-5-hydroxy-6-metoxy-1,4-benzoquinol methylase